MNSGAIAEWIEICRILKLFCNASGLRINPHKTTFLHHGVTPSVLDSLKYYFPYNHRDLSEGFRYLGFYLKFNRLKAADWLWLVEKYEKRITHWSSRWLSLRGRMVLIKAVIESQPVYWLTLTSLPSSIQIKLRQITYNFLWSRCQQKKCIHLSNWQLITRPKHLGGWGQRNLTDFSRALVAHSLWRDIMEDGLWNQVLK
jgi:hypothetical protein